jgi:hypothetical protein
VVSKEKFLKKFTYELAIAHTGELKTLLGEFVQ